MKKLILFFITIFIIGCSNTNTTNSNDSRISRNRDTLIYDSILATILYNNGIDPRMGVGKVKTNTKSKTDTNIFTTSTSHGNSSLATDPFGKISSGTDNTKVTTTKIKSKTRTKSTSAGIGVSSGLWF